MIKYFHGFPEILPRHPRGAQAHRLRTVYTVNSVGCSSASDPDNEVFTIKHIPEFPTVNVK